MTKEKLKTIETLTKEEIYNKAIDDCLAKLPTLSPNRNPDEVGSDIRWQLDMEYLTKELNSLR